jgi:Tfp pilus assembly protein FimT
MARDPYRLLARSKARLAQVPVESFDDLQSRACRKAGAWRVVGMYVY